MHLKVFLKLKNPKNSLFWANIKKNPKTLKKPRNLKKNTELVFFLNRVFSNPAFTGFLIWRAGFFSSPSPNDGSAVVVSAFRLTPCFFLMGVAKSAEALDVSSSGGARGATAAAAGAVAAAAAAGTTVAALGVGAAGTRAAGTWAQKRWFQTKKI